MALEPTQPPLQWVTNFFAGSKAADCGVGHSFPFIGDVKNGWRYTTINLLKPTGYVMHQQFNIQQLYALPTLYLCVLYLSENKQRLVPLAV